MIKGKLIGIGLGPGDPDLITLKGFKALKEADIIYYPSSSMGENKNSFSATILQQIDISTPTKPFLIPMKSSDRLSYYNSAYKDIKNDILSGKKVAVVSEGDLLFFSTFGYILKLASSDKLPLELIPGIPAFIAAGSLSQRPIVEGQNNIKIIALPVNFKQITKALEANSTIVIMKMKILKGWYEFLKSNNLDFFYAEQIATSNEYSTTNIEDLKGKTIPYFATLIIYNNNIDLNSLNKNKQDKNLN